jgi:prohibitin 2
MKKIGIALLVLLSLTACEQVDTGHRGVQTRFGEVDEKLGSLPEGLYFYNPFTSSITEIDTRIQTWQDKANTYTRDVQQANITFVVNYHLDPTKAHTMFKTVGRDWDKKLTAQAVVGPMKETIGQYEAVELVAKRLDASAKAAEAVKAQLATMGIIMDSFELVNIQYLKDFEEAVEAKQIATQRAVAETNKTVQIQEQALEKNAKLVEYEAVQKWDGKLPHITGGVTPFINVK